MNDLKRDCYAGKMPGIKEIYYTHVDEVGSVTVTGADTVSVELKPSGRWGMVKGKRMSATAAHDGKNWRQEIRATLPGWTLEQAVGIGHLTAGRYLVKFTDNAGDTWLAGHDTPLHLAVTRSVPDTPAEYQGIELTFSCESEFGFLKQIDN